MGSRKRLKPNYLRGDSNPDLSQQSGSTRLSGRFNTPAEASVLNPSTKQAHVIDILIYPFYVSDLSNMQLPAESAVSLTPNPVMTANNPLTSTPNLADKGLSVNNNNNNKPCAQTELGSSGIGPAGIGGPGGPAATQHSVTLSSPHQQHSCSACKKAIRERYLLKVSFNHLSANKMIVCIS